MRPGRSLCKLLLVLFQLFANPCWSQYRHEGDPMARTIRVHNLSDSTIEVYWMSLHTEERVLQFQLVPGKTDGLNTHYIHEFEIVEKPNPKTGLCGGKKGNCRKRHFQISEYENQLFTLNSDFKVEESNTQSRAKQKARAALKKCRDLKKKLKYDAKYKSLSTADQLELLTECAEQQVNDSLAETQEVIHHDNTVRINLSTKLALYACNDTSHPETDPIYSKEWNRTGDDVNTQSHTTNVYFEADATIIASIENVFTPSDCQMILDMSQLDDTGTQRVQWAPTENPRMGRILSKVYKFITPALRYKGLSVGMPEPGQRLLELHRNTTSPTHSDESWIVNGAPIFGRVFLFCEAPKVGGAIHFPESGIHVYPRDGRAMLMTYTSLSSSTDPWSGYTANYRNSHIDCPIVEGNLAAVEHVFRIYFS